MSHLGLVPVMALAKQAGLAGCWRSTSGRAASAGRAPTKADCLVAGIATGADSIEDAVLPRHGANRREAGPGLNAPVVAVSTPLSESVAAATSLRGGNAPFRAGRG